MGDHGPASEEAVLAALDQSAAPLPAGAIAVRVAERLAPGPDLVAWLASAAPASDLPDYDVPGAAHAWRRVAAYAQAQELAHVAQMASCAAQRDKNTEVDADGRPARVPAAAAAEVSLALTMTTYGAAAWTDLAVDLQWRLRATGLALAGGLIDLPRARLIAEATGPLTDTDARAVEEKVLPTAGQQTTAMLRATLRRAVIAADPEGAQRRQDAAERRAKVSLYPEQEGTATLTAQGLPAISAAAAMARITAMARAMKTAGAGGGLNFLRAQVLTGLLLGTLPLIPPAPGAPPDDPSVTDPGDDPGNEPGGGGAEDGPWDGFPGPLDEDAPDETGDDLITGQPILTGKYRPDSSYRPDTSPPGTGPPGQSPPGEQWAGPRDNEDWLETGPIQTWPGLPAMIGPAVIPPGLAPPSSGKGMSRPVPGLLDVTVPWHTLTGTSTQPGHLGRIGPITAADTRQLADCAARDPATIWRIVITSSAGQALAVTRLPRRQSGTAGLPPASGPGPGAGNGLVGRITVTIPEDTLDSQQPPSILLQALRHAAKALASARATAQADADASGCAHLMASEAYQIPARLRDYISARDVTCRFTTCRQPVWCCDIDHTTPYDQGGRTCPCNTGGLCRTHHQIKQLPGWCLQQVSPGAFRWTTPSGRSYTVSPDTYPL